AVGDAIVDENLAVAGGAAGDFLFGDHAVAEFLLRALVAPVTKRPFGEFHDVALVHKGHRLAAVVDRVLERHAHQALRAELRHRLHANAGIRTDALAHLGFQALDDALRLRRALRPLDAGVDVFRVLAEDDDVHEVGTLDRRRRALEVADRAHARIEIEHLAQRDVQTADAAAHRRRERSLDGNLVGADRLQRIVRQPLAVLVLRLLSRWNFEPDSLFLPGESLLNGGVENPDARAPDVGTGAVTFYIRND